MRKSGRDVVVRLVVVGLCQNATVTLSLMVSLLQCSATFESVNQKMIYRIFKKKKNRLEICNVRSWPQKLFGHLQMCQRRCRYKRKAFRKC